MNILHKPIQISRQTINYKKTNMRGDQLLYAKLYTTQYGMQYSELAKLTVFRYAGH